MIHLYNNKSIIFFKKIMFDFLTEVKPRPFSPQSFMGLPDQTDRSVIKKINQSDQSDQSVHVANHHFLSKATLGEISIIAAVTWIQQQVNCMNYKDYKETNERFGSQRHLDYFPRLFRSSDVRSLQGPAADY